MALVWAALCATPLYAQSEPAAADAGAPVATTDTPAPAEGAAKDTVSASLSQRFEAPEEARVGQRLALDLTIEHPSGASVHLPDSFGNPRWELTHTRRESGPKDEASTQTTLGLVFQIFRPGSTTLPSFPVTVMTSEGASTQVFTDPIEVKVVSVLPADKTPALEPHQDPRAVWADDYTPAWAGGILLTALLAAGLGFFISRRRDVDDIGPPPRPAHVVALEKLSALTTGDLLDRGEYMIFYVRMSEAVREYLGRRYGFRGTELTTTEILDHLERVDWPAGLSLEDVREWLLHCDLIKFSGVIPKRERAEQALRRGFSFVELTRPSTEQAEPAAEGDEQ